MISTLKSNSLVSRAISKAMGGKLWFHCLQTLSPSSSSRASSAIALPFFPASTSRCLQLDRLRNIGSAWVRNWPLPVVDMDVSVDDTILPTAVAIAVI